MYKGKVVLKVEIDMNIPESTEDLLPLEDIRENIKTMDEIIEGLLAEAVFCPEDGITGSVAIEDAYIDAVGNSDRKEENENG